MNDYFHKYLKYKDKYIKLKKIYGGSIEDDIKRLGIILIRGVKSGIHELNDVSDIKNYIEKQISEKFINAYGPNILREEYNKTHSTKLDSDDKFTNYIMTFFDNCFNNLLITYKKAKDLQPQPNLKETANTNVDEEFIYNTKTGLSGIWKKLDGLWYFVNNNSNNPIFEQLCNGKTWLVIDKYFVQFMFFTPTGIMKFSIFPDPSKINFNYLSDKSKPEISSEANIYIRFDESTFIDEYTENLKILFENENYKDMNSLKTVMQYMYNYHSQKKTNFIALLGKARFWVENKCTICETLTEENKTKQVDKIKIEKCVVKDNSSNTFMHTFYVPEKKSAAQLAYIHTKEIMSNLLFRECNLGIVTGGYSGLVASECGITRTGYEIAKHYEKPIVTIMCNAGRFDKNKHSDAIGYYGMHWGDDTKALSSLVDGAVMIAPFGAWSQVELFYLSYKKKPVCIYLDIQYIIELTNIIKTLSLSSDESDSLYVLCQKKILYKFNWDSEKKEYTILDILINKFELSASDKYGLSIFFKDLIYNKVTQQIIQTPRMNNILDDFVLLKEKNPRPFTLWYPHYIKTQDSTSGIPVYLNYSQSAKYILYNLPNLDIKINILKPYINESTDIKLTLNRNWENPFNVETGSYSGHELELDMHTD